MIFDTVSISELQKSPAKAFKSTQGIKVVLQNNKKAGALIAPELLDLLEKTGALDLLEDYLLLQDPEVIEAQKESEEIIKTGDYSKTLTFDELCKSL